MGKSITLGIILLALAAGVAWQQKAIRDLRADAIGASGQAAVVSDTSAVGADNSPVQPSRMSIRAARGAVQTDSGNLSERVTTLEGVVARLQQDSEYLMARGQLPLAAEKLEEIRRKLADANLPDRDRLQALRLLRRNNAMSDDVVQSALNWLQTATNSALREDLVEQFEDATNSILREPLIKLATTDTNPDVREQAVDSLRRFASDPQVEALLWNLVRNDADGGVREDAEDALIDAPMTEARVASLRAKAIDPQSTLDERLLAVRALRNSREGAPDVTAALAQYAQTTQDPSERARVFDAFDGRSDPNMKLPLVYGLQDPNPIVRERAADALSGYQTDPVIVDWLRHVAANDADPRVRDEAQRALRDRR